MRICQAQMAKVLSMGFAKVAKNDAPQMPDHHVSHWVETSKASTTMLDTRNSTGSRKGN